LPTKSVVVNVVVNVGWAMPTKSVVTHRYIRFK
jgi:hypothetical protein